MRAGEGKRGRREKGENQWTQHLPLPQQATQEALTGGLPLGELNTVSCLNHSRYFSLSSTTTGYWVWEKPCHQPNMREEEENSHLLRPPLEFFSQFEKPPKSWDKTNKGQLLTLPQATKVVSATHMRKVLPLRQLLTLIIRLKYILPTHMTMVY